MKNSLLLFLFIVFAAVRAWGQCSTLKVTLTPSSPSICSGSSISITATVTGGTPPYNYAWSTGDVTATASGINKAGTYTVIVTDKTPGCSGVKGSIPIAANPTPPAPTVTTPPAACPNSSVTLNATAPAGAVFQWYDASGVFQAGGASYATPPITANTTFYVDATIGGCTSPRTAVNVTLVGKPATTGATTCYGSSATLRASGGGTYAWYASASGGTPLATTANFTTPALFATTTYYVVVTSATGCVSAPVPVKATVTPPLADPVVSGTLSTCSGGSVTLHATGTGSIDWFSSQTGGTSLITSPDFTTPSLAATTTYYVQSSVGSCVSNRIPVTVTVNTIPPAPVVVVPPACSGSSVSLTPTNPGPGTYRWYNAQSGGIKLFTGPTFVTPALNTTTTYYVEYDDGCTSPRVPVTVTITPTPAAPTVQGGSGGFVCVNFFQILHANGPGGTYEWFSTPSGGAPLFTGPDFQTPLLSANTTYYLQATIGSCTSARTAVTVTVLPAAAAPAATGASVCPGDVATLSVTAPSSSDSYAWYTMPTGGAPIQVGPVYDTPPLNATTIYYVEATNINGCPSPRTAVTATVVPLPPAPTVNPIAPICPGTTAILNATGVTGTVTWYDAAVGGNVLGTGVPFTTPVLNSTRTIYVGQATGACSGPLAPVTIPVIAVANPQFQYPSGSYCTGSANTIPVINNVAGGTFSASPAGIVFVSTTTGEINIAASAPGTYTISFAGNGPCPIVYSAKLVITSAFNAQFSIASPVCHDAAPIFPTFSVGASAGSFTAAPAGLRIVNNSTGEVSPIGSTPGTYTITNTIPGSGSCAQASFSTTITIDPAVTVVAGPNQTVASGTPVTMAGSITGAVTTGTWSGGTGSFTNPMSVNAIYNPGPGETSATLTLTSSDPPGSCGPKSAKMTVTFIPAPAAPNVPGTSVCPGSVATLTATAPGTYNWYSVPAGGTPLVTGPTLVTPALTVNTTYYVSVTTSGGTSPRAPVLVTVNIPPPAPSVAPVSPVCAGSVLNLTATGSPSNYEWYGSQTGSDLLWVGATFPTPALTTSTTYWVRSSDASGCVSGRIPVAITVKPVPRITSTSTGSICSGNPLTYTITADQPGATFSWSRAAVAGISNPAVTNQTSSTITETLNSSATSPLNVTYVVTPSLNGCDGTPFNYVVTVNPAVNLVNTSVSPICNGSPVNFTIQFNIPGTPFSWSRAAVTGISNPAVSGQGSSVIRESLQNTTTGPVDVIYLISFSSAGCTSQVFPLTVTVNPSVNITSTHTPPPACSGVAFDYTITSDQPNATFIWSRAAVAGISNPAVAGQTSPDINETLVNTTANVISVVYSITPSANGCSGSPLSLVVKVNPAISTPVINANSPVCNGNPITLQTPTISNATYNWSGPNGFTSALQNPSVTASAASAGTYTLFVTVNGCNSPIATADVVVDPLPVVTVQPVPVQCTNATSVPIIGTVVSASNTGYWTVKTGTGSFGSPISVLSNTYLPTAADIAAGSVVLTLNSSSKDDCPAVPQDVTITFKSPSVTSSQSGSACSGTALNYTMTSDFANATFTWSRAAVAGISNPAVNNQTSSTITETLINTGATPIQVQYIIMAVNSGCTGAPATYSVTVNPIPSQPTATSNSPVCINTTINLQTPAVAGAAYSWTGPNGFTSASQNPTVPAAAAAAGTYNVTVNVAGCESPAGSVNVVIDPLPTVDVGPNKTVAICPTTSVQLAGSIGGSATGGVWTTSGTGTFTGGGNSTTNLNAQYFPSAKDNSNGAVELTLTSTSQDNCSVATDKLTVLIQLLTAVDAGPDQIICSQDNANLAGQITIPGGGTWTTSGTGTFSPSASQLNAAYVPSAQDITNGSVVLTLTAAAPGTCYIPSDQVTVTFAPPPTVSAGPTKYVLKGQTVTLDPTVSDPAVTYSWSPNTGISSTSVKNPVVTGNVDETYTLTVTDSRGCTATSSVKVIVSPTIVIPNAFTPNGDGVNDQWNIVGLSAYRQSTIDIFDRNGQKVFHSIGYGVPWDGTYSGKQVPYGVYYYIINPNFSGLPVLSGSVTVIR